MRDYPEADRIFLNMNYRCNRQITDAAAKVIAKNHNRVEKQITAVNNGEDGFCCMIFESESEEAEFLLSELSKKQHDGKLNRCAMICRTNYECALWAQSLHKKGIPFTMKEKPQNSSSILLFRTLWHILHWRMAEETENISLGS